MRKVKEYLDKNLFPDYEGSCEMKPNGHYDVQGLWEYPKDWRTKTPFTPESPDPDHMSIQINNETILVGNMSVNGVWSQYSYLQTYEHIPRGEADENGYYRRSTEDEVLKYISEFYDKIKSLEK